MTRLLFASSLTLSVLLLVACADDGPLPKGPLALDGGSDAAVVSAPVIVLPPDCPPLGNPLPTTLSCTGLYGAAGAGSVEKALHTANREFAPGVQLWTDGAEKRRWISLPEGTKIDTSNPNGWVFPNGTRIWKEFAFKGKRAETRFMYKKDDLWDLVAYRWNETDTEAVKVETGGDVPLAGGGIHSIPLKDQCTECHRGSRDKVLGFQHVLLGLPTATGLNLTALVAENRLTNPPARTTHTIPDDGTGAAGQALAYLHVNCGVSCHNEVGNAAANMSKMFLRIDPAQLGDPTPATWNIVKMTVGQPAVTPNFSPGTRIVPGSAEQSLIVQLATTRGSNRQMPALGTRVVDTNGLLAVREWITRLGGGKPAPDAGSAVDAGPGMDAAPPDAGAPIEDAAAPDAAVLDADSADAEVVDAGAPAEVVDAEAPEAAAPPVVVEPPPAEAPPVPPPATEATPDAG